MWMNVFRQLNRQFIDSGRVACSILGKDVELDTCLTCPWLKEFEPKTQKPYIRCQPAMRDRQPLNWL